MKLEDLLLGVLLRNPSTGYDLKKYLDTSGRFLRPNTQMSQVYRSLARMERDGWIAHEVQPRPGAQDAKIYRVTEEGATVFLDWLKGPYHPPDRVLGAELRARLAFAGFLTVEEIIAMLDVELAARREQIARYRFRDRRLPLNPDLPFDAELAVGMDEWLHRRGAATIDAHVAACEDLRGRLLDGKPLVDGELPSPLAPSTD
ncbi:helix-turn-helix transcriptional regulator [Pseudonocardia sichuanensis]|uniref:DNA-binding PadR family transcriptional regulator n=1 Tax=Pseudonocardia kunmingensis TaxID=630975 RepID=A0A543DQB0_9PSEU|nr:PadR family transcriptional regulator [Pseudonocardia kunmingensis]TQM11527.1 DNA-binding PadR family transcriptional regulator [Pseudonocardia kunmingensis]